ncbi:uncharacterized protein PHALS_14219 [Plasmopara halstedii]|uniref:Uncharacterized protein n=1 Tax=Plasmopara halstedii TaxID=4781 RepID=A0A0P1ARZ4_PLAHL|nr:uncharacterized protein PHALS_14219 [Plasmopara halstedii]CEG43940.1 hypothetical protein PHALS_14219 [Plasmopara halstedii]|eukprot:XP_024580309.1 hypothetical protein PHALS_14219 [Plasmopara halstedii]
MCPNCMNSRFYDAIRTMFGKETAWIALLKSGIDFLGVRKRIYTNLSCSKIC